MFAEVIEALFIIFPRNLFLYYIRMDFVQQKSVKNIVGQQT